jgi:hypothetical protein
MFIVSLEVPILLDVIFRRHLVSTRDFYLNPNPQSWHHVTHRPFGDMSSPLKPCSVVDKGVKPGIEIP